jgi:hypothetical protein
MQGLMSGQNCSRLAIYPGFPETVYIFRSAVSPRPPKRVGCENFCHRRPSGATKESLTEAIVTGASSPSRKR